MHSLVCHCGFGNASRRCSAILNSSVSNYPQSYMYVPTARRFVALVLESDIMLNSLYPLAVSHGQCAFGAVSMRRAWAVIDKSVATTHRTVAAVDACTCAHPRVRAHSHTNTHASQLCMI